MSSPSFGWERLNDVYYRNRQLYSLDWDVPQTKQEHIQNKTLVAIAAFTKTLATYTAPLREDSALIEIFSGAGASISSISWNHHVNGRIQALLWTAQEVLVVVAQSGVIRIYYDFEGNFNEVSVGNEAGFTGITAVKIIKEHIMVLSSDWKIFYIETTAESPVPHLFRDLETDLGDKLNFHSWDVIQKDQQLHVLISLNEVVYVVSYQQPPQQRSMDGPFQELCAAPNGEFLALHNVIASKIFIVTVNFNKILLEYNVPQVPTEIKWCGSDAVVVALEDSLKLIAPGGSIDFYLADELITMATEVNGLTILTDQTLEYLSKVHTGTVDVFKIGSTSHSSILLDAVDKLNKHSPKANENLRIIGSAANLTKAIDSCLDAALDEFDSYWQKKLLKAASFAKSEIELKSVPKSEISKKFVKTCNILRILNEIRSSDIGLFLTYSDYSLLGIEKVLKLLIKRQKFSESFEISKFLSLPIDLIFIDWACCKIKYNPNMNDEELSQSIISKFQTVNNDGYISFDKIANTAFQEGRVTLAKILINFESLFSKQIPLLLRMDELDLALTKALDSQDIDLIWKTLLILQKSQSLPMFFKMLNNFKNASHCFEFFQKDNFGLLKDYFYQADRLIDIANIDLHTILNTPGAIRDPQSEIKVLNEANESYGLAFKSSNDHRLIQTQLKLTKLQAELTESFNIEFTGLSIIQTLEKLILLNQTTTISKFTKDFKISDKKLYYVKTNFFVEHSKFDELYEYISTHSKRPLIGYGPILQKLLSKGETRLGLKLLSKADVSYEENIEYLVKFRDYQSVIDQATLRKDLLTLQNIKPLVNTPRQQELLNEAIKKVNSSTGSSLFNTRM